jgi:hypothetical protein
MKEFRINPIPMLNKIKFVVLITSIRDMIIHTIPIPTIQIKLNVIPFFIYLVPFKSFTNNNISIDNVIIRRPIINIIPFPVPSVLYIEIEANVIPIIER